MAAIQSYRLKQLIAVGSFAEVWQSARVDASGASCADDVALKIGRHHFDDDRSQREQQVVLNTAPLQLEGFIQVLDVTKYHDRLVIALELADDSLLGLAKKGLAVVQSLHFLKQTAVALDSLHAHDFHGRRLIHGAINPTDILIRNGKAKLADLGPYPMGPAANIPSYKLICMGPEFWSQPVAQLGPETDQYALAATYVWLRLRNAAFARPTRGDLLGAMQISELPMREQQVLSTAMNPEPKRRYPSCLAFIEALTKVL
jgi:serine/threonine protein kinase